MKISVRHIEAFLFLVLNHLLSEVRCQTAEAEIRKRAATPFACPHDGYFPDPDSCSKYFLCAGASNTQHDCGEGLTWDAELQLCGWANTIDCRNGNRPWEKMTDSNGVTLFPTRSPKRAKKKRTTYTPPRSNIDTNFTCPWDGEGYYPDPQYCHVYHYCLPGLHTVLECANGLWFSEPDETCMWPTEAVCAANPQTTKQTTMNLSFDPLNPFLHFVTPETAVVYGTIECPSMKLQFFPDPYDCSAYHFCNGGKDKVLKCEPGLYYDKTRDICDWRKNVNCKHVCPTSGERMKFVHATSCCRYYECVNSELREFVCPYPKLFSTETKQCESYQVVKCGIRENCKFPCDFDDSPLCAFTPKCEQKIDGHYIDEYRPGCKYYYLCKEERTYNYTTCDYGYRFNEKIKRCDLASNVKCGAHGFRSAFTIHHFFVLLIIAFLAF